MPIHDWSRVFDGVFHAFHHAWIAELQTALNSGILPAEYYAMAEQVARPIVLDILTLQSTTSGDNGWSGEPVAGATAVAMAPPRVRYHESLAEENYTRRQRSVVIRPASDDRIIALIEILSAGNKSSEKEFRSFVTKAVDALDQGYHLLLIDLQPRTARDPGGIHPVIWDEVGGNPKADPSDQPLTLVAYDAGPPMTYYEEPVAIGDKLLDMPLFLAPGWYVSVPLEATYQAAWRGVPRRYKEMLEPTDGAP
ncbi:MAG: DUF4058 family protein [Isosphaeraceae bacterium]